MTLRFGLKLSQGATIDELRDVWRVADDEGFDSAWVMDHFASLGPRDDLPIFEAWTLLAGMAALTSRVRIGCAVLGNTYRHPGVLAKQAVTVDHLSGGRLELGLGAGWAQNEHTMFDLEFGTAKDRADRLDEAVPIIKSLFTKDRTTYEGERYRLVDAVAEPKPVQRPHPPIWIGGSGPRRTLRLAAEHADVWNAAGGTPEEVAASSQILDRHCADVGRDPATIRRSVQVRYTGDDDELLRQTGEFAAVGVTDFLVLLTGGDPGALARRAAALLPRLRDAG